MPWIKSVIRKQVGRTTRRTRLSSCSRLVILSQESIKWSFDCWQISLLDLIWCHINDLGTLDSIRVNPFSYSVKAIEGQWDTEMRFYAGKQQKIHKSASWHPMTSALEQKAFRHCWHGAYRCQTLPLVPQRWFVCFTGCNCFCVLEI